MLQLVELLSQETLVTILFRSESGLTLMSVCTLRRNHWRSAPCKHPIFTSKGRRRKCWVGAQTNFFFSVIEMKICTLGFLSYLTWIPSLALAPFEQIPSSPRLKLPLALSNISTAMKPQALHLCHVLDVIVLNFASVRAPGGMNWNWL